jgi:DNA-binding transcriptional MerR regulator
VDAMATQRAPKIALETPVIPDRLYFKIGDVARICNVKTYVLRFWETQFPQLKPNKSGNGQRLYRRRDVEIALDIKRLVHGEGFTIAGARQVLEQNHRRREPQPQLPLGNDDQARRVDAISAALVKARTELREIAQQLGASDPQPARRRPRLVVTKPASDTLFPL